MDEVKQAEIELVMNAMKSYVDKIFQSNTINLQNFVATFEPIFAQAGYRTPPKIDEKLNVLIMHDAGIVKFAEFIPKLILRWLSAMPPRSWLNFALTSMKLSSISCSTIP